MQACSLGRAATLVLITGWCSSAAADVYEEFHGVRSHGMGGAHRAVGSSNDTLTLNPAGMAIPQRYAVEMQYSYSAQDGLSHIAVSAVDSKSGPVAGGIGYTHDRGDSKGVDANLHRIYLAAAYAINPSIAFGVTTRNVRGSFNEGDVRRELSVYNGDVGLLVTLSEMLNVGFAYHNVIKSDEPRFLPSGLGFGTAARLGDLLLAADLYVGVDDPKNRPITYHAGAEYFAAQAYPLRIGYQRAQYVRADGSRRQENLLHAGVAWVSAGGAIDLSYQHSLERGQNWEIVTALKFFL